VTGLDVSRLSADDAVAALRSYPRRFRAAVAVGDDDDVVELAGRVGPAGTSGHDHLVDAASSLMVLGRALHQVVQEAEPLLHPAVVDPTARQWAPPPGLGVADLVGMITDEATELADTASRVSTFDWHRTARVADGPTVTALDVVREAVRTCSEALRGLERAMASARRD
jgi:hypothetical protein